MKAVRAIQTILAKKNDDFIVTYIFLRRTVGIIGISLPFVLALGNIFIFTEHQIESSISAYYHTGMRDVFVGLLFSIAIFLLAYRGPQKIDSVAGTLASIFAVGVALFPTSPPLGISALPWWSPSIGKLHAFAAIALFSMFAVFSLWLFRKTAPGEQPPADKKRRNAIFLLCGVGIVASMAWAVVARQSGRSIFWLVEMLTTAGERRAARSAKPSGAPLAKAGAETARTAETAAALRR